MKRILFVLTVLFLVSCDKEPVNPSTPDTPTQPLADGAVIENAVTDYDGNTYNAIVIGEQVWMQSNLRTTHYDDGTEIPLESEVSDSIACYYYEDHGYNVADYGYLYNWKAVMRDSPTTNTNPSGAQGICPTGWHVPSDAEWVQLEDYLQSQSQYYSCDHHHVAKALASETGWNLYNPDMDITNPQHILCCVGNPCDNNNATGFSAFPAGYYGAFYNGCFIACIGQDANFWSTTEYQDVSFTQVLGRLLNYSRPSINRCYNSKRFGYSVRCLRN